MNLKTFIKTNPVRFWLTAIGWIIIPALSITNTYVVQEETNILLSRNWTKFILINVLAFLIMLVDYGVSALVDYQQQAQVQDLNDQVRDKIVKRYYYDGKKHTVAQMQNRLTNDLQMLNNNYFINLFLLIYGVSTIVFVLIYLVLLSWQLLLAICLMVAISLLLPKLTEKPLQKATELISDSNQKYLDTLNDWLSGLDQLQQFLAGAKLFSVVEKTSKKLEAANVKQTAYIKLLDALNGIVSAAFGLALFVLAGWLVKNHQIPIGALLVVGNFRYYLNGGINTLTNGLGAMKGSKKLLAEVDEAASDIPVQAEKDVAMPSVIKTEDLVLKFPNGEKLTYPDLKIKQGEKILLTGDSGAGKSTLFKLILGELKPSAGKIIYEDKNDKKINPDLSKIGYLPQDPVVFPASIEENITMFNEKLDGKVNQVVNEVNFADDIAKFTEGLDEKIDLDKLNISGGQRQKIVLARAKVHNSNIILIDEGTSAIDQKATMSILKNLLKSKATIVFIAHNFNEEMHQLFDREIHLVKE